MVEPRELNSDGDRPLVVVTGAGQGIGAQLARRFAAAGYQPLLVDRDEEKVQAVAATLGCRAAAFDLTDDEAVATFAAGVPSCAVLVNNAALTTYEPLLDTTTAKALAVLGVNLLAPLSMTRALAGALVASGRGSVVNMSSIAAHYHPASTGIYSTSKAAVEALTRALAVELGPLGVRCNAVGPGTIPTEGSADHYGDDDARRRRATVLPLGRLGSMDDIADAVMFLASEQARYITGQVLMVDGGHTVAGGSFFRIARETQ